MTVHLDDQGRPSWTIRRRVIVATLLGCGVTVAWCLWRGEDTELAQTAVASAFTLAGAVVGSYVFGAAWDDRGRR